MDNLVPHLPFINFGFGLFNSKFTILTRLTDRANGNIAITN